MAPVTSGSSSQPHSLEGDEPGEKATPSNATQSEAGQGADSLSELSHDVPAKPVTELERQLGENSSGSGNAEESEVAEIFLPLKNISRMQVLSCIVQIETKSYIECTNKGCLYISLTIWDMAYHLPQCEGAKGNDKLKKCRYCPHGTLNEDVLNGHLISSHSYALKLEKKEKLEFKDLRQEEREAFLTSSVARAIIRSQWRICYQTKGYIICLTQPCGFVTCLIPVMEDHFVRCSPELWEKLEFSCESCPGKTFTKDSLDAHTNECHSQTTVFNTVHPRANRFWEQSLALYGVSKCIGLHCKFVASNKHELERHWRYCRTPHIENYVVCQFCGGWCDTSYEKDVHIRTLHSGVHADESAETSKQQNHLEIVKNLIRLDLSCPDFPWDKVMSYGGETHLKRLIEGIELDAVARKTRKTPKKRKKGGSNPDVKRKTGVKKEKCDVKKNVVARRRSSRASEINSETSLHAIKAEELYNPDKTFLQHLGQAIAVESLETPKVELQISVGDQSWTVQAPCLETASEVITRKMPSYSMKSVLAQSIEDSLNLLKIEAKVSSIENIYPKPYVPPVPLGFIGNQNIVESLKKKFNLIRQKRAQSFVSGDSFMDAQEFVDCTTEDVNEMAKKKQGKKKLKDVRPWQSLARIKQEPHESEPDDSENEDIPQITERSNTCKRLLPKRTASRKAVDCDQDSERKELTIISRPGKNCKITVPVSSTNRVYKKLARFGNADSTSMVRDVSIQHGSPALPVLKETLIKNWYNRATLLIGYPYSRMKTDPLTEKEDKFTQTTTRDYSGRPQILKQKPNDSSNCPTVVASPVVTSDPTKKMVVIRTLSPVDPVKLAGAQVLKDTRLIRLVNGPTSGPVPVGLPIRTLVPCAAPSMLRKVPGVLHTVASSTHCSAVPAPIVVSSAQRTPPNVSTPIVKSESVDIGPTGNFQKKSVLIGVASRANSTVAPSESLIVAPTTATIVFSNAKPTSSVEESVSGPRSSVAPVVSIAPSAAHHVPGADKALFDVCTAPTASNASIKSGSTPMNTSEATSATSPRPHTTSTPASPATSSFASPGSTASTSGSGKWSNPISKLCDSPNVKGTVILLSSVSTGSDGAANVTSSSSSEQYSVTKTINMKTYCHSNRRRNTIQTSKRPRLSGSFEGCSDESSVSRRNWVPSVLLNSFYTSESPSIEKSSNKDSSCCRRLNLSPDDEYGIFQDVNFEECHCSITDIRIESKPGISSDNNSRTEEISDPVEHDTSKSCYLLDPSIPFDVFCDSSAVANGGLYNEKCPWEGKTPNIPPGVEKPVFRTGSESASQTTLLMEVDESPVIISQLKMEPDDPRECSSARDHTNELAGYLANHEGIHERNEPMVYMLTKILPDQRNTQIEDERRFKELVHYLTHYNRILPTSEPLVYVANKISRELPSTSTKSGKGQQDVNDRKSVSKSVKTTEGKSESPSAKRQQRSAEEPSSSKSQELSEPAPLKRGRKSKVNEDKLTNVHNVVASTKLDDLNGHRDGKSTKNYPRKSKNSVGESGTTEKQKETTKKKGGTKVKSCTNEAADISLDMEVEAGDDITAWRKRMATPKKSTPEKSEEKLTEDAPQKPKRRGRPLKDSPIRTETPIKTEREEESNLSDTETPSKPRRRGKSFKAEKAFEAGGKSPDPTKSEEETPGDAEPPPKPKKRGRPSKPVVVSANESPVQSDSEVIDIKPLRKGRPSKADDTDWTPNEDSSGNVGDDAESDEGLTPAPDRIIFNSSLRNPNKMVTCARCNDKMTARVYKKDHVFKHNHICWLTNEEPMDLEDEVTLERHLYKVYCHLRKPFRCELCSKSLKSSKGFISHRRFCGKSIQERQQNMVACKVCSRLLKPFSVAQHMQNHHSLQLASPTAEERVGCQRRASARSLDGTPSSVDHPTVLHVDEDAEKLAADSQPWIKRGYHLEKRRITQAIRNLIAERFDYEGVARCFHSECDKTDTNVKIVIEHYKTCDKVPLDFKCNVCNYLESNESVMIHHVRTKHPQNPNETGVLPRMSNSVTDAAEFSGKFVPYLRTAEFSSRSLLFLTPAVAWTYQMRKEFLASGSVFPELSLNRESFNNFDSYAPSHFELREKSMRIAFNGKSPEWINLTKLTSFQASGDSMIMYTGGVVRSLDWFPADEEQYLIVAIGSIGPDSINVRSTKSSPGHLQIWSAGKLDNFENPLRQTLTFEFALCHDFGEVWDLQCCPGGKPDEKRLGLVALATSSGKVAVYAVPSVPTERDGTPKATKPEPALVLETGLHETFHVSKVAWSKVEPHRLVAAGFTNGMVAVWDLTTTSILLKSEKTILPFKIFHPHFITITGLSFSPILEYYIVTSCADRSSKYFNLEDSSVCQLEFNRGLFMDVAWLPHWMSTVAAIDDNTTVGTTTAMIHPLRNFIYQAHPAVTQPESCCMSVSVNDWLNAFVCGYDNGHVLLTFARKHNHILDDRKRGHAQLITPKFHNFKRTPEETIDCQNYAATSENFGIIFNSDFLAAPTPKLKPVPLSDVTYFPSTAANKVCWNPNVNSFLTMAVGYHSGFVIIGRISLHPTEQVDLSSFMSELLKSEEPNL